MPSGGSYDTTSAAIKGLQRAVESADQGELIIKPELAKQNFCSGATYLLFLAVLERLHKEGRLSFTPETIGLLRIKDHQADGSGAWGRWNANGPGTARLFFELQMGRSFTDFEEAEPGDFLKIFWNENIGSKEFGHSVIYMGSYVDETGQENVKFWSSNKPGGFGFKSVPLSRIKRAVFTRLENPNAVNRIAQIPERDPHLAALSKRSGTEEEICAMIGIKPAFPSAKRDVSPLQKEHTKAMSELDSNLSAAGVLYSAEPTKPVEDPAPPTGKANASQGTNSARSHDIKENGESNTNNADTEPQPSPSVSTDKSSHKKSIFMRPFEN